jgi:hypothetical protein
MNYELHPSTLLFIVTNIFISLNDTIYVIKWYYFNHLNGMLIIL